MKSFKIKAYGQTWKVRVLEEHPKLGDANQAYLDDCKNEILIEANINEDKQMSALMHEIVELINVCNELGLTEQQVFCLESGLYMIIHDNKLRF